MWVIESQGCWVGCDTAECHQRALRSRDGRRMFASRGRAGWSVMTVVTPGGGHGGPGSQRQRTSWRSQMAWVH